MIVQADSKVRKSKVSNSRPKGLGLTLKSHENEVKWKKGSGLGPELDKNIGDRGEGGMSSSRERGPPVSSHLPPYLLPSRIY